MSKDHWGNKAARSGPYPDFKPKGKVYLVGAGPGDPELLTLKAKRLLASCDLLAYDDLVHPEILNLASPKARLVAVGYRARGEKRPLPTHREEILEAVKRGETVVRLKTGDPMVLARGAEEAMALRERDIAFEFVPGITAALGVSSYTGIPLTARKMASGFRLATGHCVEAEPQPDTLVLYMVRHRLAETLTDLERKGYKPDTKACYVASATAFNQSVVYSTLQNISADIAHLDAKAPGLLIVGSVVDFGHELNWFQRGKPLAGHRVLVARARPGPSKIASALRDLGCDVINSPMVQTDLFQGDKLDQYSAKLRELENFDTLVLASVRSVDALVQGLIAQGTDLRYMPRLPVLAIGKGVPEALARQGLRPAAVSGGSCPKELAALRGYFEGKKVCALVSEQGRPHLQRDLENLGGQAHLWPAYRYVYRHPRIIAPPPSLIVAPSSSALKLLVEGEAGFDWREKEVCCIGPDTMATARRLGFQKASVSDTDAINAMVALVFQRLSKQKRSTL